MTMTLHKTVDATMTTSFMRRPVPHYVHGVEPESEDCVGETSPVHSQVAVGQDVEGKPSMGSLTIKKEYVEHDDDDHDLYASEEEGSGASPVREFPEEYAKYRMPQSVFARGMKSPVGTKRKRAEGSDEVDEEDDDIHSSMVPKVYVDFGKPLPPAPKRKGSSDFLRKGQWTPTEERLARLLIEAFEEGYLPIYTGIRLRGYLAVQLQCDPMRVSKKLCAGTIDGKRIPKNYGQKKFRLRRKQMWDREEAGRILGALERLTKELWAETGIPPPSYLTLSSTRNAEDEMAMLSSLTPDGNGPTSPVKKLSPAANKSKKQKNGVVFPIIYLNLSKKLKASASAQGAQGTSASGTATSTGGANDGGVGAGYASQNDSDSSSSSGEALKVDGESLQAAYELLNLHHHWMAPSSSMRPAPMAQEQSSATIHRHHHARDDAPVIVTPPGMKHLLPAPSKPAILRQQTPSLAS